MTIKNLENQIEKMKYEMKNLMLDENRGKVQNKLFFPFFDC